MKYIHTKTQEEFAQLMEIFDKKNYQWFNGSKPRDAMSFWNVHKENTIVRNTTELIFLNKSEGDDVISFQDYLIPGPIFIRGEKVIVWNQSYDKKERIYLYTNEGSLYPYSCISDEGVAQLIRGENFDTEQYGNIEKMDDYVTITMTNEEYNAMKDILTI